MAAAPWWQEAVVYQIYPKSFNDTTGNGIGDIQGIIEKLDYIKELGTDVIWLTPVYKSPQNDNGYDISDYFDIHEEYGTMEDFDRLLKEAHLRDLRVIMDIVVNHTSTEHKWFQESMKSRDNPYRDYYIWKDPVGGEAPTNWQSKFGGNAWKYDEGTGQYYLHLFDVTQADLNWENEDVRTDVYEMMKYWAEKGIDGFRLDVINLVSKDQRFPNDDTGDGRKFYTDGPRVHEFMHEMNRNVFAPYDLMTVGEMSSTTIEHCVKYTRPERQELSMTFSFHHLKVDYPNGEKWTKAPFDLQELKQILSEWQTGMHEGGGWNALFWCNHDQPRVVSRFGDDSAYRITSAKMLATTMHMMKGTPYIYQGEEIGMPNPAFDSIDKYRDVESLNSYQMMKENGKSEEEIIEILKQKSRDNSRTPMQWNDGKNAGFTTGTPWIDVPANYEEINVQKELQEDDSIFQHYQKLIRLRKQYGIITYGDYELLCKDNDSLFAYKREMENERLIVLSNFYGKETKVQLPPHLTGEAEVLVSNYSEAPSLASEIVLKPYESVVYHMKEY